MKMETKELAICPYCEEQIKNIELDFLLQKGAEGKLVKKSNIAFLCPKCHKIISIGVNTEPIKETALTKL